MVPKENPGQTGSDPTWITPAEIHLSAKPPASTIATAAPPRRSRRKLWRGFGLLALALLGGGGLFVLSRWISVPPPASELSTAAPPAMPSAPWNQTQQARRRAESQEILAQLSALQKSLQEQGVETWASAPYAAARQLVEAGDTAYRSQKFAEATAYYQRAFSKLQELQARSEQVFTQLLARGRQALNEGAPERAIRAFQGALRLRPENPEAEQGRRRAEVLAKVRTLIAKGNRLVEAGHLEQARPWYERALQLDAEAETARTQLQRLDRQREARQFRQAMSHGYGALAADDLEKARNAFSQAITLNPQATEARDALNQVEQRLASERIAHLLAVAQELEQSERWQEAVEKYSAALSLDPHLILAQEGKQEAARRASLQASLEQTLTHPERLADAEVYQAATQLLRQAQQLDPPGSKLRAQITALSRLLEQAATPVTVTLQSDNKTEVTLYRVGKLGKFKTQQIPLRPGRYVAVGIREGYRDVRTEFLVSADEPPPSVVVQAEEKIPR